MIKIIFLLFAYSACFGQLSNYIGFPTNISVIEAFTGSGSIDAGIWDEPFGAGAERVSDVLGFDSPATAAYIETVSTFQPGSELFITINAQGSVAAAWYFVVYIVYDSPTYENQFYINYGDGILAVHEVVAGTDTELDTESVTLGTGDKIGFRRTDTFLETWYDSGSGWTLMSALAQSSLTGAFNFGFEFSDNNAPGLTFDNFSGGKIRQAIIIN